MLYKLEYMNPPLDVSITPAASHVAVVILNWNGKDDTLDCLKSISLLEFTNYTVIVVDNGSVDDSVRCFYEHYSNIIILKTGENLGYAGGNNVGIRYALKHGADYVLVLNNDTVVDPKILHAYVGAALALPKGGIFCGKIYFYSEPTLLYYAGATFSKKKLDFVVPAMGKPDADSSEYNTIHETDIAVGCSLFATREVLEKVGVFDERYFLVHEESDLCYSATQSGYKIYFVPQAKLWHKASVSFGGSDSPLMHYFWARNRLLWAENHLTMYQRLRLYAHIPGEIFSIIVPGFNIPRSVLLGLDRKTWWALTTWAKDLRRKLRSTTLKAELIGIKDYIFRRFGDCPDRVRKLPRQLL